MSQVHAKKRPGRPPKVSPTGKARATFSVRLRETVRVALIDAADQAGRSVSEEIERRIERTFERDGISDPATASLGDAVSAIVTYHQVSAGELWTKNEEFRRYVFERVVRLLARRMQVVPLDEIEDLEERRIAKEIEDRAAEHDREEGSRGRRWPGPNTQVFADLADAQIWPVPLKTRYWR